MRNYYLIGAGVSRDSDEAFSAVDVFVDHVVLHEGFQDNAVIESSARQMRMPQARPNDAFLEDVDVTGEPGLYIIQLTPYRCAHGFGVFSVEGAEISEEDDLSADSEGALLTVSEGLWVNVTRVSRASPPLGGAFNVTLDDVTSHNIAVSPSLEAEHVRSALSLMDTLGDVEVTGHAHCSAFTFTVTMTTRGGDVDQMTLNGEGLTGTDVTSYVTTVDDGSVWFSPVPGDMLRTVHSEPQLTVFINNVPTRCKRDADCSYTWSDDATPTVTGVHPTSGTWGTELNITGTGFDDDAPENNSVTLGGADCVVTSASSTSLQCTVSVSPAGSLPVRVRVSSKGLASGDVIFTYMAAVTSIVPVSGGYMGGLVLTVNGQGFGEGCTVMVGDVPCPLLTRTLAQLQCTLPAYPPKEEGVVAVQVHTGWDVLTSPTDFTYTSNTTALITGLSTASVSAWGQSRVKEEEEEEVEVEGPPLVTVNSSTALTVLTHNDTHVQVQFPPLGPGSFPLALLKHGVGFADQTVDVTITVTLKVTGLTPTRGSLYGGTLVTVTGQGFGTTATRVEVKVGNRTCDVEHVTDANITCRVRDAGVKVIVTNQGKHKHYGTGYAWSPRQVEVTEGDTVRWQWTTPTFVHGIAYGVYQLPSGFTSPGGNTANGWFEYRFTTAGTFPYWSGPVNAPYNFISLHGQVKVTERQSSSGPLLVRVGGQEAEHVLPTIPDTTTEDPCGYPVEGCEPSTLAPSDPSLFHYTLDRCATPTVTSITPRSGTSLDEITFTGTGFGTDSQCVNEVTYAGAHPPLPVSTNSSTRMTFTLSSSAAAPPPIKEAREFALRVGNLGNALVAIADPGGRTFATLPAVTEPVRPSQGSLGGGTLLTVVGAGLDNVVVTMNGVQCGIQSQSYSQVTCLTPPRGGSGEVSLDVTLEGEQVLCDDSTFCSFTYAASLTPVISDVTPDVINSSSPVTVTVSGERFGSSAADVTVTLGGVDCEVLAVSDGEVVCSVSGVPAGSHVPQRSPTVTFPALLIHLSPQEGSVHGGTLLTITGLGFGLCVTPAHAAGEVAVQVTSEGGGVVSTFLPTLTFTFSEAASPVVLSVEPSEGVSSGDVVVVTGEGFSPVSSDNRVTVGGEEVVEVTVVSVTGSTSSVTELSVLLPPLVTGLHAVWVHVAGKGLSNDDVTVQYSLGEVSVTPTTGTTGGHQTLTLTGSGFLPGSTDVTVCGLNCQPLESTVTATHLQCLTAPHNVSSKTYCDVTVSVNDVSRTAMTQYSYDPAITPTLYSVTPEGGGTAGGTLITLTGTGFGSGDTASVSVTVGEARCEVQTVNDTCVTCVTTNATSGHVPVNVARENLGRATKDEGAAWFRFTDRWSSPYTWGGGPLPDTGDLVVIPPGHTILLDTDTPVLAMLLIQGDVIFDEMDVELNAETILITNGGTLQVGTESKPHPQQYNATITLHGHRRSKELPIYGAKTLAVREGTLDLHGHPTPVTWTLLSATATSGSRQVHLTTPVNWRPGDHIVLPTTSHPRSQNQNEVHVISAVSADGLTLTLRDPLTYDHVGERYTLQDGSPVALRGEVGLLTHNVKVMGSVHQHWVQNSPGCSDGLDTGEVQSQTCSQGRFGAGTGSDQFGAHIIAHAPEKDTNAAVVRLSYIEISHAGQAFRMGRYPVHLHLNGDMSQSYVRGLGIHNSFNRAVNIHGTHNVLVEHVVMQDIQGGAVFLEDGDERGNTLQYNLAVGVRASSSLLNHDLTPAGFWVTHPDNVVRHNHVAGGTHFGFWYHLLRHPAGSGFDSSVCPRHVPLNSFENNTAHSLGRYGLWIFQTYTPRQGGGCHSTATHQAAVFQTLTAWNCQKGAEWADGGAIQFRNFVTVNNEEAGVEMRRVLEGPQYDDVHGPMLDRVLIVGRLDGLDRQGGEGTCSKAGVVLPYGPGLLVRDVAFHNLDCAHSAAFRFPRITGLCSLYCGGFTCRTTGLAFWNVSSKVHFDWASQGVIQDMDGSLTGWANHSLLPSTPDLPPAACTPGTDLHPDLSSGWPGAVCDSTISFVRFSFNRPRPSSLLGDDAVFTNQYGSTVAKFAHRRVTHNDGWMTLLVSRDGYQLDFLNAAPPVNISYDGVFTMPRPDDYTTLTQWAGRPDRFTVTGGVAYVPESDSVPDPSADSLGTWSYNDTTGTVTYLIKPDTDQGDAEGWRTEEVRVALRAHTCFYQGCQRPDPAGANLTRPPPTARLWSDPASWDWREGGKPVDWDNVTIPLDQWLIIDEPLPPLTSMVVVGGLSASANASLDFTLEAEWVVVYGRLSIGWQDEPFSGNARILLRGQRSSPDVPSLAGPHNLGSKVIAVYGALELHGYPTSVRWTRLSRPVGQGNVLHVQDPVDWRVGDEVMLTATGVTPWHTEVFRLTAVDNTTLTVNDTVRFPHLAHSQTLASGRVVEMNGRVALLTRNIVIEGDASGTALQDSFGARVLVARATFNHTTYIGYASISNVEWYRTGQEGWVEPSNPRYSLAFVDVPVDADYFPSSLRDSAFHHGFSPAVGVFFTDGLEVSGNVIHHTVGSAIHTTSKGTIVTNNLMAMVLWPGTYQGRYQTSSTDYPGAVEAADASDLVLTDNTVSGCERAAYRVAGQRCDAAAARRWSGNEAHSCLVGVASFPADSLANSTCSLWAGFFVWRSGDVGLYVNGAGSQRVEELISVENALGYTAFVVGPPAAAHAFADKFVEVVDSVFVGRTSTYDCDHGALNGSDPNVELSGQSRVWRRGQCGITGLLFPSFLSGPNGAPRHSFTDTMSYPAIKGRMALHNVSLEEFEDPRDVAVSTNPQSEDLQHPVFTSNITLNNVSSDCLLYFHPLSTRTINPADCVDMNCDGLKKAMLVDTDGTLLGSAGTVLPDAGFQWDQNASFGVGDHRLPPVMLTDIDGNRLNASDVAPFKGIYGHENCTWDSTWNAYQCGDSVKYALLTIESMDEDTETRRLSPVAVYSGGYVDLINGPQDHGWCSGYTCRKRLSTFPAIVPLDHWVEIYLTGTVPDHMRFILLNVGAEDCVGLSLWKALPHRLDVSVDGSYVLPTNGYVSNDRTFMLPEEYPNQFMPSLENRTMGDHYVDHEASTLHWVHCGPGVLEFQKARVLVVSFGLPAMTDEEFFGEQIVNNLAQFLSIPVEKVRIVDVVREDGGSRRKRSTGLYYFLAEVGDAPGGQASDPVDLEAVTDQIVTQVHFLGMDQVLSCTVLSTAILEPQTAASIAAAATAADNDTAADGEGANRHGFVLVRRVGSLELRANPAGATEMVPFAVQPLLQFRSPEGELVEYLGTHSSPWEVEVSLLSGGDGNSQLLGTKVATFVGGVAQFSDLVIDLPGENFVLSFTVVKPEAASNYSLQSLPFDVSKRPVALLGAVMTHHPLVNAPIQLSFRLVDHLTKQHITDLGWRNHTWTVTASLAKPELCPGRLEGDTSATIDPATSTAEFTNIVLTDPGLCFVTFTLTSDPPEYEVGVEVEVPVMTSAQRDLKVEERREVEARLALTFDPTTARYFAAKVRNHYGQLKGVRVGDFKERPGSVVVTLTIEGSTEGMDAILKTMCDDIHQGVTFTYDGTTATLTPEMTVDGKKYYGAVCHADDDPGLHPEVIAVIVLACVLVIVVIVFVLLWRFKVYPKTKTYDSEKSSTMHLKPDRCEEDRCEDRCEDVEDVVHQEDIFLSLRFRDTPKRLPPLSAPQAPGLFPHRAHQNLPSMPGIPDAPDPPTMLTPSGIGLGFTPKPVRITDC
ncbi:LOW QUALITY PROTEIN: fibrocystin-L-like [Babylonia areolata]|uniref:LOW QUALITY PROTEIN: fibrocystin-L-like n=1 Tax=Babylonia areolata TaxID=304850 RepID=UPI003FD052F9